jgi:hypothetical protein
MDEAKIIATLHPNVRSDRGDALKIVDGPGQRKSFSQSSADATPRGRILMPADGWGRAPATIELFQKANLSTLVHELGHQWLEELRFDAEHPEASEQLKQDWAAVQKWFADQGHPIADGVIPVDAHEVFARGIERYLMEGKAPAKGVAGIFEKIRGWMVSIYRTVDALRSPITPEIRQVFDRLLATDEAIAASEKGLALNAGFEDAKALGMTDAEAQAYTAISNGARDGIGRLIDLAAQPGHNHQTVEIGHAESWLISAASDSGISIDGMAHTIDTSAIRHIIAQHGSDAKEQRRGQVGVSESDLKNIPEVVSAPDSVIFGAMNSRGQDLIAYVKKMIDGTTLYVEEVRVGRGRLAAISMRKYSGTIDATRIAATLDPHAQSASRSNIKIVDGPQQGNGFQQSTSTPRGRILMPADGWGRAPATIELFQKANLSTLVHELGHQWLEELRFDAEHPESSEQLKQDWAAVQKWFADQGHPIVIGEIPVDAHEVFARGIERYLMEGKAPTKGIAGIFEKIRGWMVNIYRTVDALRSPITPEIRQVFDRLLATDEEIAASEKGLALNAGFEDAKALGMTDTEAQAYTAISNGARDEANRALLEKTMAAERRKQTAAWNEERRGVRAEETARLEETPLFSALRVAKERPLDRDWIIDRFGEDALSLLPKRVPPMFREGGAHPDDVAEMSGYESGEEMLRALMGAEKAHQEAKAAGDDRTLRNRIIDQATDTEMTRRHGDDPFNDGSVEEKAAAIVNEKLGGKVLEAQLKFLGEKSGNVAALYSIARIPVFVGRMSWLHRPTCWFIVFVGLRDCRACLHIVGFMMGRRVNRINLHGHSADIGDVVPRASWNKDAPAVGYFAIKGQLIRCHAHLRAALARFQAQELIGLGMGLKANSTADRDRHQRQLQIAPTPGDRAIISVTLRRALNIERLRLWPNVFDPASTAAHDRFPSDYGQRVVRHVVEARGRISPHWFAA